MNKFNNFKRASMFATSKGGIGMAAPKKSRNDANISNLSTNLKPLNLPKKKLAQCSQSCDKDNQKFSAVDED